VRFLPDRAPERLNTRGIDALKQMNLGTEVMAKAAQCLLTWFAGKTMRNTEPNGIAGDADSVPPCA
jgi:hypothetical protein